MNFVVQHADGRRLACKGAPGRPFFWGQVVAPTPENVLTWTTYSGASRFADMNGGKAKPISELAKVA